jgi:hypothetical protein
VLDNHQVCCTMWSGSLGKAIAIDVCMQAQSRDVSAGQSGGGTRSHEKEDPRRNRLESWGLGVLESWWLGYIYMVRRFPRFGAGGCDD